MVSIRASIAATTAERRPEIATLARVADNAFAIARPMPLKGGDEDALAIKLHGPDPYAAGG